MDGHDRHHRLLAAFLAGELNPADARRWDEHLLACEQCWRAVREDRAGRQAVQLLRQPAPPGLADRVRFAVELAAAGTIAEERPRHRMRLRWRWPLAASGWCCACGGWAAWRRWLPSPPSRSPCPPAPAGRRARAWRGLRGWGKSACTAATATPQNWWRRRSQKISSPRWRRGCHRPERTVPVAGPTLPGATSSTRRRHVTQLAPPVRPPQSNALTGRLSSHQRLG